MSKIKKENLTPTKFLSAHRLMKDIYITGMYYSGITIYNQQVRTLNLVFLLCETRKIPSPKSSKDIVIIGAGVSGITAAIAFKTLGYNVVLFEKQSLLLHLQHGCSTRQIHPNLEFWPREEALKPFTELPFANWDAGDASSIEKKLVREIEQRSRDKHNPGSIEFQYPVNDIRLYPKSNSIKFKSNKSTIKYSLLFLATGFGLEKYVEDGKLTKSYWRNDDLSQLRIDGKQNFFISGVGDGGASDLFRLSLIGFDPQEWAKYFENVKNNKNETLISRLRQVEIVNRNKFEYSFFDDFSEVYDLFKSQLDSLIRRYIRSDVKSIILNGRKSLSSYYSKNHLLFINSWLLFVLEKNQRFLYYQGSFPENCGKYYFKDGEYYLVVRHGTTKNADPIKEFSKEFQSAVSGLAKLQGLKAYNEFSLKPHWSLEFWNKGLANKKFKRFFISKYLLEVTSVFLSTINSIIRNYLLAKGIETRYRATLHRLILNNEEYYFQQISAYVGNKVFNDEFEIGRAFPLSQGVVGFSMRNCKCLTLSIKSKKPIDLFRYSQIFARPLSKNVQSMFVVPIPNINVNVGLMCLYIDTDEKVLMENKDFRELIYWSLSGFISTINKLAANQIPADIVQTKKASQVDLALIRKTPELIDRTNEVNKYWEAKQGIIMSNNLVDIYDIK